MGFRTTMRDAPVAVHSSKPPTPTASTRPSATRRSPILRDNPEIAAVYSIGGGNKAILDAFQFVGRDCRVFIAHDLDRDNLALIQNRQITAVLHHDLRHDMRRACQVIMQANGAIDGPIESVASQINVITPYNVPFQPIH